MKTQTKGTQIKDDSLTGADLVTKLGFYDETKNYTSGMEVWWLRRTYRVKSGQSVTGGVSGDLSNAPDIETSIWEVVSGAITVGINGDYATISAALADNNYNIKLISDITENANIDLTTITNIDTGIYSIDLNGNTFSVSGDNISLENMRLSTGTITVNATADKTLIINCRTETSIVDNGINTTLRNNQLL